jgi:hypothetical protein
MSLLGFRGLGMLSYSPATSSVELIMRTLLCELEKVVLW